MSQIVDFRVVEKGFTTLAAALTALSGSGNAGKFVTAREGTVSYIVMNIGGDVSYVPDLRDSITDLQAQINALKVSGGTNVFLTLWDLWSAIVANVDNGNPSGYDQFNEVVTLTDQYTIWVSNKDNNKTNPDDDGQEDWTPMRLPDQLTTLFRKP